MVSLATKVKSLFASLVIAGTISNVSANDINDTKIAFSSNRDGNYEIYVMDSDGTNQQNLTNNLNYNAEPSWSPNGKQIAFSSNYAIYVMDSDGTNQQNLTNNQSGNLIPSWSPDGRRIAFRLYKNDGSRNYEIYTMRSDGTDISR